MQSSIKPKLGNAASLFNNAADSPLYQSGNKKKPVLAILVGFLGLSCLLAAIILMNYDPIDAKEISRADAAIKDENISMVNARYEDEQLVGTLVHAEEDTLNSNLANNKTTKLTEQERARLLDIISRQ